MIVKCEHCEQSYQIDETKLPDQGGRIRCTQCSKMVLIKPKRTTTAKASPKKTTEKTSPKTPEKKPEKKAQTTWKVRSSGLTYACQGMDSLRDWLLSRNDLNDIKVAKEEDDFCEIGDYAEIMTPDILAKFFPLGNVPTSKGKAVKIDLEADEEDEKKRLSSTAPRISRPRSSRHFLRLERSKSVRCLYSLCLNLPKVLLFVLSYQVLLV